MKMKILEKESEKLKLVEKVNRQRSGHIDVSVTKKRMSW